MLMVAVLMVSVIAPTTMTKQASAASDTITAYVLQKDNKLYALDTDTYLEMKGGDAPFLKEVTVTHVKSSSGKIYELAAYLEAKGSIDNGTMNETLQILDQSNEDVDVPVGEVVEDSDGNISLEDAEDLPVDKDFKVLSIE